MTTKTTEHEHRIIAAIFACRSDDCPQPFALYRDHDVTGVPGTGTVAHGVQFADGLVVIRWLGDAPSVVVWNPTVWRCAVRVWSGSLDDAMKIHGHGGKTRVVWLAAPFSEMGEAEREAAEAERKRIIALARKMGATCPVTLEPPPGSERAATHEAFPFADWLEDTGGAP